MAIVASHDSQRFEIDGVRYDSIEDVPQPFRDSIAALIADHDGDGTPDVFQTSSGFHRLVHHSESYEVDGVTYASIDEIPEPQRSRIRAAVDRQLDLPNPDTARTSPRATGTTPAGTPAPIVTRAGWSGRAKLIAAFVAIDAVVAVVVAWSLFR